VAATKRKPTNVVSLEDHRRLVRPRHGSGADPVGTRWRGWLVIAAAIAGLAFVAGFTGLSVIAIVERPAPPPASAIVRFAAGFAWTALGLYLISCIVALLAWAAWDRIAERMAKRPLPAPTHTETGDEH
jgi:cytochrome c biogenesis protein CcdA